MTKPDSQEKPISHTPTITIWVHGTKRLPHVAPLPIVKKFFDCKPGLHPAHSLDTSFHHRAICETLVKTDPQRFPADHIYLFGWSGKLSFKEREQAAQDLNRDMERLIQEYEKKFKTKPKIRVITHSHGGNVALNLARQKTTMPIEIDELILLACPVQVKTKSLIQHAMFKKIYSLYSIVDMIQVADPQGLYAHEHNNNGSSPLFSQRRFPDQSNLVQHEIRLSKRPIMHVEFMLGHFLKKLPSILASLEKAQ